MADRPAITANAAATRLRKIANEIERRNQPLLSLRITRKYGPSIHVTCPRCGGDGGDRYLCGLCKGQGKVKREDARRYKRND